MDLNPDVSNDNSDMKGRGLRDSETPALHEDKALPRPVYAKLLSNAGCPTCVLSAFHFYYIFSFF